MVLATESYGFVCFYVHNIILYFALIYIRSWHVNYVLTHRRLFAFLEIVKLYEAMIGIKAMTAKISVRVLSIW